jgi:hypothetical protein
MKLYRFAGAFAAIVAGALAVVLPAGADNGHRTGGTNTVGCAGGSVSLSFVENEASSDGDSLKLTVDRISETDDNGVSAGELPGSGQPNPPQGDDWTGVDNSATATDPAAAKTSVQLRAERAGSGLGRVYTIDVSCSDRGGSNMENNSEKASLNVCVPHDQSPASRAFCAAAVAASRGTTDNDT